MNWVVPDFKSFFMRIIFAITFGLCFCVMGGCSFVAKSVNNVKKPKVESAASIIKWLDDYNFKNRNVATIVPSSYYSAVLMYSQGPMLFNKKGEFVSVGYNYDGKFCPKGVDEFLKTLYPGFEKEDDNLSNYLLYITNGVQDTTYPSLQNISSFSRDVYGHAATSLMAQADTDYTLVLPFSIFMGHTSQVKKLRTFLNAVAQNQSARINIILLNYDKQLWWGEEWLNKISIEI